jgi:hypothetical protein
MEKETPRLFMLLVGGRPPGRHTEQHDVFFSIGPSLKALVPALQAFWPEVKKNLHIDAWREVNRVDGYEVHIYPRTEAPPTAEKTKLFFLNLGGYKPGEFEEYHYKMLVAASDKSTAIKKAKSTAFFQHTGFKGAAAHIDDKYGVDVDDIYELSEILSPAIKEQYTLVLTPAVSAPEDELHLGYFRLDKL